jgi:hypothetical protein
LSYLGQEKHPRFTLRTYVHLIDDGLCHADFLGRAATVTEPVV